MGVGAGESVGEMMMMEIMGSSGQSGSVLKIEVTPTPSRVPMCQIPPV